MRTSIAAFVCLLALGAGSAGAGGFATASVESPPDEIAAGQVWKARVTIKQHGRTPLDGLQPAVTIRQGETAKTFPAEPTGETGVYVARVEFPSAGAWRYEVNDGFGRPGQVHTFAPIDVAGPSGGGGGGADVWWLVAALGTAGAGGLAWLFRRRWSVRPSPRPA